MHRLKAIFSANSVSSQLKLSGRMLLGGLLLAAAALVLSSFTPKRTEGVVAASVQVVNPSLGVDLENPARMPFQQTIHFSPGTAPGVASFSVPDDKVLVIEDFNGFCDSIGDPPLGVTLATELPPGTPGAAVGITDHVVVPFYSGLSGEESFYTFAQHMHIYAAAGSTVQSHAINTYNVLLQCSGTVSGYLIKPAS